MIASAAAQALHLHSRLVELFMTYAIDAALCCWHHGILYKSHTSTLCILVCYRGCLIPCLCVHLMYANPHSVMWQAQGMVQGSGLAEADDQRLMNFTLARPTVSEQGNRSCRQVRNTQCSPCLHDCQQETHYTVQQCAVEVTV